VEVTPEEVGVSPVAVAAEVEAMPVVAEAVEGVAADITNLEVGCTCWIFITRLARRVLGTPEAHAHPAFEYALH
jgi:hypothetical protein